METQILLLIFTGFVAWLWWRIVTKEDECSCELLFDNPCEHRRKDIKSVRGLLEEWFQEQTLIPNNSPTWKEFCDLPSKRSLYVLLYLAGEGELVYFPLLRGELLDPETFYEITEKGHLILKNSEVVPFSEIQFCFTKEEIYEDLYNTTNSSFRFETQKGERNE